MTGTRELARLRPREDVVAKAMDDAVVLVHLGSGRIFELNRTGARVWTLLHEGATRDEICARLVADFGRPAIEVGAAVDALLHELADQGLIGV